MSGVSTRSNGPRVALLVLAALLILGSVVLSLDPSPSGTLSKARFVIMTLGLALLAEALIVGDVYDSLRTRLAIFAAPLLAIAAFALFKSGYGHLDPGYVALVSEDHVVEYATALALMLATPLALRTARLAWLTRRRSVAVLLMGLGAFTLFVGLEEISYGQRIFEFATPEELSRTNMQGEFNLHNVEGVQWLTDRILPNVVLGYGLLGWIVLAALRRFAPRLLDRVPGIEAIVMPWYVATFLLPFAIFRYFAATDQLISSCCYEGQFVYSRDQEPAELFFGLGFLLFAWDRLIYARRAWLADAGPGLLDRAWRLSGEGLARGVAALRRGDESALAVVAAGLGLGTLGQFLVMPLPGLDYALTDEPPPSRAEIEAFEARLEPSYGFGRVCVSEFTTAPECRSTDQPEVLVWGDGAAKHLVPAVVASPGSGGAVQMTWEACMSSPGIAIYRPDYGLEFSQDCIAHTDRVLDWLQGQPHIELVVVSSHFGLVTYDIYQRDGQIVPGPRPDLVRASLLELEQRLEAMGKRLVVVSPVPAGDRDMVECQRRAFVERDAPEACDFAWNRKGSLAFVFLEELSSDLPVVFLDEILCPDRICRANVDGVLVFGPNGFLTPEGSHYLGEALDFRARLLAMAS